MSDERQDLQPETPPTPEAVPTPPTPHPTAAIVDAWFASHIAGSVLGRSTEAWNHLQTVIPILKDMLAKAQ